MAIDPGVKRMEHDGNNTCPKQWEEKRLDDIQKSNT